MIKKQFSLACLLFVFWITTACSSSKNDDSTKKKIEAVYDKSTGISRAIPSSLGDVYNATNFDKYTRVIAPNGGSIHIVAQSRVSEEQVIRSRSVLEHYLKNLSGSAYGNDKSAVANKMAENKAILCLLNGKDDGTNPLATKVTGQPLYEHEIQVEGHTWYMNQDYEHRDATFEEILHLVHDKGIGVDDNGVPSTRGASPKFQQDIRTAQKNGLLNKLWGMGEDKWIKELTNENSLSQEYLAAVVDSYYGLWGAWKKSSTHGMWGFYIAKSRADLKTDDPMGYELMNNKFFHTYLNYNARIHPTLNGNFSLKFDNSKPYTHHSRYLKMVTLLGNNDNSVTVNELDNNITGNSGVNTVIFSGNSSEYSIKTVGSVTTVTDKQTNRDGKNTLKSIEILKFKDVEKRL